MSPESMRQATASLLLLVAIASMPARASVSCACEHQGSTADGLCAAVPDQELTTVPEYHWFDWGYLQLGNGLVQAHRFVYRWTPIGPAILVHPNPEVAAVSYQCPRHHACGLRVDVFERIAVYSDNPQAGLQPIGGINCLFFTGGEARWSP